MSQCPLIFDRAKDDWSAFGSFEELGDPDGLRYYQREAVERIEAMFATSRSLLAVLATGLGKTQIFCALAKRWVDGDVLILAHRDELVMQARDRLEKMTGQIVEVEKAEWTADKHSHFVVGSVQSFKPKRLERMGKDRFGLVILDEAHHGAAKTFKRALDYFEGAKVLGVTATPDRADEKALGALFDEVAYVFDIEDGIQAGYLTPVDAQHVVMPQIDLSGIDVSKGDFAAAQLDDLMLKSAAGICEQVRAREPDRSGILFFPGCKSAEFACQYMNKLLPGSSCYIDGKTDQWTRRCLTKDFKDGRYVYLMNCDIATEGFDAPEASLVVPRMTLSRSKYAQMVGRGCRVLPGVVDDFHGAELSAVRRAAIAASRKPNMMILDFHGNWAGKAPLQTPEDLLGGNYSDDEVKAAKKLREKAGGKGQAADFLREARRQIQELANLAKVQVTATVRAFDPFGVYGIPTTNEDRYAVRFGQKPMTPWQREILLKNGFEGKDLEGVSKAAADKLLNEMAERRKKHLCTYRQLRQLQKFGITDRNIGFDRATEALDYIGGECKWRHANVDAKRLNGIITRRREMGDT